MLAKSNLTPAPSLMKRRLYAAGFVALTLGLSLSIGGDVLAKSSKREPQPSREQTTAREPAVQASAVTPPTESTQRTINMGAGKSIIVDLPEEAAEIFIA